METKRLQIESKSLKYQFTNHTLTDILDEQLFLRNKTTAFLVLHNNRALNESFH